MAADPKTSSPGLRGRLGLGGLRNAQLELLQRLANKHLTDPGLVDLASGADFAATSAERGLPRYEHPHLVAALDILLAYQTSRRAVGALGLSMRRSYRHDSRTRCVELLKHWLRANAANAGLGEEELRRMCALLRDFLNHAQVFPARNQRSFMHTLAEVYEQMKLQLREVLQRDRTCAELAARVIILSRNLISDAVAYLLLGPTDLQQTDALPSVEVVSLWQSLPAETNPLPRRADAERQRAMREAWPTLCGSLVGSLLSLRLTVRLFGGTAAEAESDAARGPAALADDPNAKLLALPAPPPESSGNGGSRAASPPASRAASPSAAQRPRTPDTAPSTRSSSPPPQPAQRRAAAAELDPAGVLALIERVREDFRKGSFRSSGLAGAFRETAQQPARETYLASMEALLDLLYLLGEVFTQFHRISDGLGDYGMIRVAPWLHPFLEVLIEKVQKLKKQLEAMNEAVDSELVLAKARGRKIPKPQPTEYMAARAHAAVERAVQGRDCHATLLMQTLEELRSRSAPERLPHVMESVSGACQQLQAVLSSPQFRARVGPGFPEISAPSLVPVAI